MPNNTTQSANNWITHSPIDTSSAVQSCLFYFVQLDNELAPILGTMMARPTNTFSNMHGPCNEGRLTTTQMQPLRGQKQCFFPNGNRYFYLVSQTTKQIIPNSMILVSKNMKPAQMCIGTNHYLEYKSFVPTPNNTNG